MAQLEQIITRILRKTVATYFWLLINPYMTRPLLLQEPQHFSFNPRFMDH